MTLRRPSRILFPQKTIERDVNLMRLRLRKVARQVYRGEMSLDQARAEGITVIAESYSTTLTQINRFLLKHQLNHAVTGYEQELTEAKDSALQEWTQIVGDMPNMR